MPTIACSVCGHDACRGTCYNSHSRVHGCHNPFCPLRDSNVVVRNGMFHPQTDAVVACSRCGHQSTRRQDGVCRRCKETARQERSHRRAGPVAADPDVDPLSIQFNRASITNEPRVHRQPGYPGPQRHPDYPGHHNHHGHHGHPAPRGFPAPQGFPGPRSFPDRPSFVPDPPSSSAPRGFPDPRSFQDRPIFVPDPPSSSAPQVFPGPRSFQDHPSFPAQESSERRSSSGPQSFPYRPISPDLRSKASSDARDERLTQRFSGPQGAGFPIDGRRSSRGSSSGRSPHGHYYTR
ncbi:hypothetical protein B0H67DRAFT_140568 [Lasiosphaeris hirsuta]|uniref:Uncharacterized protein n=1 Tax=Lasiosphaeris hirsuta TaxID=260670 RepID=A0AA40E5H7_9PEZI|nr:hypothetical protein B0H67DRAFT_140568 [Lasiosphaeris hirsuta]